MPHVAVEVNMVQPEVAPFDRPTTKNPIIAPNTEWIGRPVAEIWPFEVSKMAAGRHLGPGPTGSSAIRSADPENPILAQNTEWIGRPVAEIWSLAAGRHVTKLETGSRNLVT